MDDVTETTINDADDEDEKLLEMVQQLSSVVSQLERRMTKKYNANMPQVSALLLKFSNSSQRSQFFKPWITLDTLLSFTDWIIGTTS